MTVKDKWFILAVRLCGWILITVGKNKWLRCEVRSLVLVVEWLMEKDK